MTVPTGQCCAPLAEPAVTSVPEPAARRVELELAACMTVPPRPVDVLVIGGGQAVTTVRAGSMLRVTKL
jgi:spermidine synthase